MFKITPEALAAISKLFPDKHTPLRVLIAPRGCTTPKVRVVYSTADNNDSTFQNSGYVFIIDKDTLEKTGQVTLTLDYSDLSVNTENIYRAKGCGVCTGAATNGGDCGNSFL